MKLSRRYQEQPCVACCATCRAVIGTIGQPADVEASARAHATETGHQVRITETTVILIGPQRAAKVVPDA